MNTNKNMTTRAKAGKARRITKRERCTCIGGIVCNVHDKRPASRKPRGRGRGQ